MCAPRASTHTLSRRSRSSQYIIRWVLLYHCRSHARASVSCKFLQLNFVNYISWIAVAGIDTLTTGFERYFHVSGWHFHCVARRGCAEQALNRSYCRAGDKNFRNVWKINFT